VVGSVWVAVVVVACCWVLVKVAVKYSVVVDVCLGGIEVDT